MVEPGYFYARSVMTMFHEVWAEVHLEKIDEDEKTAAQNKTELSAALSMVDITKDTFIKSVIEFIKSQKAFPGSISPNEAVKAVVSYLKKYETAGTIVDALHEKCNAINKERELLLYQCRGLYGSRSVS